MTATASVMVHGSCTRQDGMTEPVRRQVRQCRARGRTAHASGAAARVDVEEVGREDRAGLGFQEGPPGLDGPRGHGVDASILEDLPDWRRRDLVPEAG